MRLTFYTLFHLSKNLLNVRYRPRRFASKQKIIENDSNDDLLDENAFVSGADATFEADDAEDDDEEVADLLGGLEV